ncbi:hypothetical protein AB5I41_24920 [Sphingomonas sp. MMS24-JH45]
MDAKREWRDFRTEKGRHQEFLGRIIAEALGYNYERYALANAGSQQRQDNIEEVQASASYPFLTIWPHSPSAPCPRAPSRSETSATSCTRSKDARWPTR